MGKLEGGVLMLAFFLWDRGRGLLFFLLSFFGGLGLCLSS